MITMSRPEQYAQEIDENLICPICHGVFQDPVSCKDGHTFCSECIKRWLKTSKKCPLDNSVMTDADLARNYVLCGILENLKVYCHTPEESAGVEQLMQMLEMKCQWTGKEKDLKTHRETCPFQQVQCGNKNCNKTMQRRETEEHDAICEQKEVACDENCGLRLLRRDLANHKQNDCPEVLVPCSNGRWGERSCKWTGRRKNLASHIETCPFQQVQCANKNCNANIQRRELQNHDAICEHKKVGCDENCGLVLLRRNLPTHKQNDCPEVLVPCSNGRQGEKNCEWIGKRKNLASHIETCLFQQVQCANENCNKTLQRRELQEHDAICEHKELGCDKNCGVTLLRRDLASHKKNYCPEVLVPCPNSCTETRPSAPDVVIRVKRKDLDNHVTSSCGMTVVTCPFKEQGCLTEVVRKDLNKHVQDFAAAHTVMLARENSELNRKCWSLYDKFKSLENQCLTLMQQNSLLETKTALLEEQCSKLQEKNSSLEDLCSNLGDEILLLSNQNTQLKEELSRSKEDLSTYVWVIYEYPTLAQKNPKGSCFKSRAFKLSGYKWYLVVYPNGDDDAQEFLSLYLCMDDSVGASRSSVLGKQWVPSGEVFVTYRLTVMSQVPDTNDISYKATMVFDKTTTVTKYPKFMRTAEALSPNYCDDSKNHGLIIKCTIYTAL